MLLAAVMAKLGTYGIIRFDLNLFPQATRTLAPLLLTLAVDRHRLRRHRGLRPARPEAPGDLLLAGPDRLHRPRHLRPEHAGPDRRCAADGQPRRSSPRCSSSSGDLRAPPHLADRRAARAAEGWPRIGRRVHRGHDGLHRPARPQRLRRRVPGAHRHLHHPPLVGRRRHRSASSSPPSTCSGPTSRSFHGEPEPRTTKTRDLG